MGIYYCAVAFELIIDAVFAFFTGGTSLAASIGNKISRVATNIANKGVTVARKVAAKTVSSAKAMREFVVKQIREMVEAIKSGKFIEWLREKLYKLFGLGKKTELKLRGKPVILKGFKWKSIKYIKRSPAEVTKLRNKFNGSIRKRFLDDMFKKYGIVQKLKKAGLSADDIEKLRNGFMPKGWNVHHKIPLDDGGTNQLSNLMLIKNEPYHYALNVYQKSVTKGLNPKDILNIDWPVFDGFLYP